MRCLRLPSLVCMVLPLHLSSSRSGSQSHSLSCPLNCRLKCNRPFRTSFPSVPVRSWIGDCCKENQSISRWSGGSQTAFGQFLAPEHHCNKAQSLFVVTKADSGIACFQTHSNVYNSGTGIFDCRSRFVLLWSGDGCFDR